MSDDTDPKPAETDPAAPIQQQAAMEVVKAIAGGTAKPPETLDGAKAMVAAAAEAKVTTALNVDTGSAAVPLPVVPANSATFLSNSTILSLALNGDETGGFILGNPR